MGPSNRHQKTKNLTEQTPLLTKTTAQPPEQDPTAIYVRIIQEHLPWYKRPSALWLLPIYGLASISSGMLTSSLGQFQTAMLCREYMNRHGPSDSTVLAVSSFDMMATGLDTMMTAFVQPAAECKTPEILAFTAKTLALIEVIGGIASTFTIGYYSSVSDKHGRVTIMILSFATSLIMLLSIIAMGKWWDQVGLPLMVISSLVTGLMGGISLGATMSLAYAADCTDPAKRSLIYSYLHAGLFLGLAIGPVVGGYLVKKTGTILTIVYIDLATTVFSLLLAIFVIPESIPSKQPAFIRELVAKATTSKKADDDDDTLSDARVAWHSHAIRSLAFFKPNGRNTNLILLAMISFLQMLAVRGTLSVIILYTNQMFQWTEYEDGILFSLSSTVRLITLLGVLPVLVHFYQKSVKRKQFNAKQQQQQQQEEQQQTNHSGTHNVANDPSSSIKRHDSNTTLYDPTQPLRPGAHSRIPTRDTINTAWSQNNDNDSRALYHPHRYGQDLAINNTNMNNQIIFNPNDPNVAASVQHLGETALEYAADDDSDNNDNNDNNNDNDNRHDRRALLPTHLATGATATTTGHIPNPGSSKGKDGARLYDERGTVADAATAPAAATTTTATTTTATTTVRTKEQTFSDMKFDTWMVRLGFAINSITYLGYGLATEGWMFYLASSLHAVSVISSPSLKSLLTNLVEPSQFGAVLGAIQIVDSIAAIFSPIVVSWVYALTVKSWPEFVWYSCAAWTGICTVLAFMIRQKQFRSNMDHA
ncbi:hypothetical protein BGZ94_003382 [Podila epigama]|nr:hypothetical protein BGZ94_003382 [Podila epigama]